MSSTNISQINIIQQDAKAGNMGKKGYFPNRSLESCIKDCIREHGTYAGMGSGYDVNINDFCTYNKKIILSYLLPASYYEEVIKSPERIEAEFTEEKGYIQMLIDENKWETYHEDMEEMRAYR